MDQNQFNQTNCRVPDNIRKMILEDYFQGRKQYNIWEKYANDYMKQNHDENNNGQDITKVLLFQNQNLNSNIIESNQQVIQSFPSKQNYYHLMGSLQHLTYKDGPEYKKFKMCNIINKFFREFHFQVSLPCQLNDSHLTKLQEQLQNYSIFNNLQRKVEQANKKYILLKDISQTNLYTYVTNNYKVTLTGGKRFAIQKNDEWLIRYFSVTIKGQYSIYSRKEAKIMIEDFMFSVVILPDNSRQEIVNNDTDELEFQNEYINQIPFYNTIQEQLKYENEKWTLNMSKEAYTFYSKVDQYPEFFYLNDKQTLIVRCKKANVRVSQIENQ